MTTILNRFQTFIVASLAIAMAVLPMAPAAHAVVDIEPLRISNIEINATDTSATISWLTNRDATGRIDYGTYAGSYPYHIETNLKDERQTITLLGLQPEKVYYFIITARDDFTEVVSFERGFETKDLDDNQPPDITDIRVQYITGTTATVQWRTDEPSTSYVEYGKKETLGSSTGSSKRTLVHDVTVKNLTIGALYHFRVKSQDEQRNIAVSGIDTFRTQVTDNSEKDTLIVYGAEPTPENNINVTETTAVIKFRTNKLSEAWVDYGINPKRLKTIKLSEPRTFLHTHTLTDLNPGQTYYYTITVRDVFGKKVESEGYSFTTKQPTRTTNDDRKPRVLGVSTCSAALASDTGFYGMYYNLPESHRDMEFTEKGSDGKLLVDAKNTDWYDERYFTMDRIDSNLNFGDNFLPLPSELPGDPFHFAVYWRAMLDAPTDGSYTYEFTANNDLWVYIDGNLVIDSTSSKTASASGTLYIEEGYHEIEVYFAERHSPKSVMVFKPDSRLQFSPLPTDCDIDEILLNKQSSNGVILGASNTTPTPYVQPAVCNPNLGYTRITALYKSNQSPDVWAILATGQKHYITSPEAFDRYECDWSRITTVSQATLDAIPNATLVRSPQAETVYFLYQRPQHKWLRINIPSPTVFVSYPENYWGNIAYVDTLDIMSYNSAKLVKTKQGSAVYLVQDQTKRLITNEDVFKRYGFSWSEVVEISQEHLNSYLLGNPLN